MLEWYKKKHNGGKYNKNEELVILLTTGSLNPIHSGHIDMMNFAKKELESYKKNSKKYTVIGGFISPSHDEYVSTKPSYICSNDRVKMIKAAVKNSYWIECDEWECKQSGFVDFPQVCEKFLRKINSDQFKEKICDYIGTRCKKSQSSQEHNSNENSNINEQTLIQKWMPQWMKNNNSENNDINDCDTKEEKMDNVNSNENSIQLPKMSIFYVCGRDHCDKCRLWDGIRIYATKRLVAKTLVVPRPDDKHNNSKSRSKSENCIVVNVPKFKMIDNRSSTQIRKYIENSQGKFENFQQEMNKMPQILDENVLKYIENNWNDLYKQLNDSNNRMNGW